MNFKDLKPGFSIYLLDKIDMKFSTEKVVSVSLPHIDAKMTATGMVVDVSTEAGTYCMIADSDVGYPMNKVVTTDKGAILREVETCKAMAEQALAQVEGHKTMIERCNNLLANLDPVAKEKQATEARFNKLESGMERILEMLQKRNDI